MDKTKNVIPPFLNISVHFLILICLIFSSVLTGCKKISLLGAKQSPASLPKAQEVKGTVIARVDGYAVTLEDLNEEIESFNAAMAGDKPEQKIVNREDKISYLREVMVQNILLYKAALGRGFDKKEEIQRTLDKIKQNLLVAEILREETVNIEPASKEIEDYYSRFGEQLKEPEERRVREIVVQTEDQAKEILIELLKGADFAAFAQERSIAISAKNKGDLGFIKKGEKFAQFDEAAFSPGLEAGKISNYFKGADGFYILKLEDKRGGKAKSLSELWDRIKEELTYLKKQQKISELIENIKKDAKIEIQEGLID